MARLPRGLKLFTAEEANQLLPQVRESFRALRECRDQIQKSEEQKAVEELSWLREDGTVSSKAKEAVAELEKKLSEVVRAFEVELEKFNALGAQLKDLDQGLVDFFSARGEELVCLCWKDGEDQIRFWHDLQSGFAGRQPLESL